MASRIQGLKRCKSVPDTQERHGSTGAEVAPVLRSEIRGIITPDPASNMTPQ